VRRALAGLVLLAGCRRSIGVPTSDLPRVARFAQTHDVTVSDLGRSVRVTDEQSPRLELTLDRPSSTWQGLFSDGLEHAEWDLEDVSTDGTDLLPNNSKPCPTIRLSEVREAKLSLYGYEREDYRPEWGIGASVAGPGGLLDATGEVFMADWAALELGVLPAPDVLSGYVGLRLRGPRLSFVRPFVGASATAVAAFDAGTGKSTDLSYASGRFGVEMILPGQKAAFLLELDVCHPFNQEREFIGDRHGNWLPWGGGSVWYLF